MNTVVDALQLHSIMSTIFCYLGGYDHLLKTLLILFMLDYITGVLKSIYNKKLDSSIGSKGIIKKVGFLIIISITFLLEVFVSTDGMIRGVIIYMFIANEIISILENWSLMGIETPKVLLDLFNKFKRKNINNN